MEQIRKLLSEKIDAITGKLNEAIDKRNELSTELKRAENRVETLKSNLLPYEKLLQSSKGVTG